MTGDWLACSRRAFRKSKPRSTEDEHLSDKDAFESMVDVGEGLEGHGFVPLITQEEGLEDMALCAALPSITVRSLVLQ